MSFLSIDQMYKNATVRGSALVKSAYHAGLPHLLVSIVFLQGLAYMSQLFIAKMISPGDFGIVRNVEAALSVMAVIASVGMPSLAVKSVAEVAEPEVRERLIGRLIQVTIFASVLVALTVSLVTRLVLGGGALSIYLSITIWIVGLTACSRTCFNYFQGIKQVQQISLYIAAVSIVALFAMTISVWIAGLQGWVVGRYIGEGLFLALAVIAIRKRLRFGGALPDVYSYSRLMLLGSAVALSLLVRTALDNSAVLSLYWLGATREEVGYYGLGTLLIFAFLILPGAIASLAVPRFAEQRHDPARIRYLFLRTVKWSFAVMLSVSFLGILFIPTLIEILLPQYVPAIPVINMLLLTVPLRTIGMISGSVFLVYNRNIETSIINTVLLSAAIGLYVFLVPRFGASGAAWSTLLVEGLGMVGYIIRALTLASIKYDHAR